MGKLFWKFFLVFWLAFLTIGGGMGTAVWLQRNAMTDAERKSETSIDIYAEPFVSAASQILQKGGVDVLNDFLKETLNTPAPRVFAVDDQGKDLLNREVPPEIIEQAEALLAKNPKIVRRILADNGLTYLVFALFPEHALTKASSYPPDGNGSPIKLKHKYPEPPPIWLPVLLGFIVSLMFSGMLAWYLAKPIRQLRSAFDSVAKGDLDTRAAQTMRERRDELSDLGKNFDDMVSKIQVLVDAQQRLLHDVSHELRSPLARIQAAIGLAYQQPDKMPLTLERIEKESQRMNDLVGELLALSRLEAGVIGKLEVIDINELIAEIVEDARLEADSKNVSIKLTTTEEVFIKGFYGLLNRAIENVLRNAIKHTRSNSEVTVSANLGVSDHQLYIDITDQGPGVAENELSAIFEPFFRGSNSQKSQSIGLGLAIAQKAIEAHNGKISACNRKEGGFRVKINLPIP
ncbi:ATP-binding protein [Methylosarcina fibrata]|uniref:ATP-binding protein n=1 Tax=Methylosarcina fibrata TaxID=105972 RepID=UPI000362A76D|nr:ATP-binding protein [Methylosarcina fibrata]